MMVEDRVYESAVKGRQDFRAALKAEREKTKYLTAVIANFADSKNWSDEVGCLRWDGKRHAIEYAQSVLDDTK